MAITDAFRSAVSAGDVRGIRIMMKDSMLVDPTFNEFNEMDNVARDVKGLYEAHDGRDINSDNSAWDDNYMNKLFVQVVWNFSHERVNHLKEVVRYLRPVDARAQTRTSTPHSSDSANRDTGGSQHHYESEYQKRKYQDQRNGTYRGAKIACGAVAGGVVGGVIAGVAGVSVFAGAAAGAVVIGAVVAVTANGE
jgi:hypothetical protein